ncbi:MAG: nucleotidyl transferase AbiEii/AbiGii toxin family protein [Chloroflexi bacterium]|nr:nucleotidyl transferase AbiEii/AbiGii toxin family protein [Chloroflexota bacterium]
MARERLTLTRARLMQLAGERGLNVYHLEKDYVPTCLLRQIAQQPDLAESLILKGGLALHHIYGNSRLSVDLDFTGRRRVDAERIREVIAMTAGLSIHIPRELPPTRFSLHLRPISYRGPLGVPGTVEIEVSYREEVLLPPDTVPFHNLFFDSFPVSVMQLDEIIAEKVRALYQRPKPGDLYDLYFIFTQPALTYHPEVINDLVPVKFKLVAGGAWISSNMPRRSRPCGTPI